MTYLILSYPSIGGWSEKKGDCRVARTLDCAEQIIYLLLKLLKIWNIAETKKMTFEWFEPLNAGIYLFNKYLFFASFGKFSF